MVQDCQDSQSEVSRLRQEFNAYREAFDRGAWVLAWLVAVQWAYLAFDVPMRLRAYREIFADFDSDLPCVTLAFFAVPPAGYLTLFGLMALFAVMKEFWIKSKPTSFGISLAMAFTGSVFLLAYREAMFMPLMKLIQSVSG